MTEYTYNITFIMIIIYIISKIYYIIRIITEIM